ncbi:MAG: transporter substrate-binding domain-containing protein [Rhodospirillales bacterium]|nr:MAG: transporter substrate-binding domain-containing protein [Rhodospirillales bacterium]
MTGAARACAAAAALLAGLTLMAADVGAQNRPAPPAPAPAAPPLKLRIGIDTGAPPFAARGADGGPVGFDVELARALCARLKAECAVEAVDWDALPAALSGDSLDIALGGFDPADFRRDRPAFSAAYARPTVALAVRKGERIEATAAGMKDRRIGAQRATRVARWLADTSGAAASLFETREDALAALRGGDVDAVAAPRRALVEWLKGPGAACCELAKGDIRDPLAAGEGIAIALRPRDPRLKETVDKALAALAADGTIKRLAERHLPFPIQ